jgi:hypothetical protein
MNRTHPSTIPSLVSPAPRALQGKPLACARESLQILFCAEVLHVQNEDRQLGCPTVAERQPKSKADIKQQN